MTRNVIAAAMLVGGLMAGASAAHALEALRGAESVGTVFESYKMPLGVRASGAPATPKVVDDERTLLHVPLHFGEILVVTPHGNGDVFWFRDDAGDLRNVIIDAAAERGVRVRMSATEIVELRYR